MNDKNSNYVLAGIYGISIGCIHGIALWATMHTGILINEGGLGLNDGSFDGSTAIFLPVSYLLYSNVTTLPIEVALISDIIGLATVLSSDLWVPKAMKIIEQMGEEIREGRMEDEDDDE